MKQSKQTLSFTVHGEYKGRDRLWNPVDGEGTFKGSFQINVCGSAKAYRDLSKRLSHFADTVRSAGDEDCHEHFELVSSDGRTRLHFILRQPE